MIKTNPLAEFANNNSELLGNLWSRWQDEKEYEDINEYGKRIAQEFPADWTLVKSNKRPFGFTVQVGKHQYQFKINATGVSWTNVTK